MTALADGMRAYREEQERERTPLILSKRDISDLRRNGRREIRRGADPIVVAERLAAYCVPHAASLDEIVAEIFAVVDQRSDGDLVALYGEGKRSERRTVRRRIRKAAREGIRLRTVSMLGEESLESASLLNAEVERQQRRKDAHAIVEARSVDPVEFPAFMRLSEIGDEPETPRFLIEGLFPADAAAVLAAQFKAGKSTMIHNLIRALVDGVPFLDDFAVHETRRVTLLDFELAERTLDTWLREQQIQNAEAITRVSLRGHAQAFNLMHDEIRAEWARRLADVGTETLIVDPLRPILAAHGLNEWNEMGPVLQAFDALKEEAGIRELVIAQHYGHHAQRAAGDSRLLGWADTIWNLSMETPSDPRSFRFFDAYGRDVDQPRGLVSLYDERRLAFAHEIGATKKERTVDALVDWLRDNPDAKRAKILDAGIPGVTEKKFTEIIARAGDRIDYRKGEKNAKHYSVSERVGLIPLNPEPTTTTTEAKEAS